MKKRRSLIVSIIILLLIVDGGIKISERIRTKNVFDEIYYSEIDYVKHHKAVGLPMMKQIENHDRKYIQTFDELTIITESYKKEYLAKNEKLIFNFSYSNKTMGCLYIRYLDKNTVLQIGYDYRVKNKICKEYVGIVLIDKNKKNPNTKEEIQQYLDQYHITREELQKNAHEILYDRVLKDWIASNNTRFSLKDIGEVTIEKDTFLTQS